MIDNDRTQRRRKRQVGMQHPVPKAADEGDAVPAAYEGSSRAE